MSRISVLKVKDLLGNWIDIPALKGDKGDVGSIGNVTAVTLTSDNWSNNRQTVTVNGVSSDESTQWIDCIPSTSSIESYVMAGVVAISQSSNALTFECTHTPSSNLTVYIIIANLESAS